MRLSHGEDPVLSGVRLRCSGLRSLVMGTGLSAFSPETESKAGHVNEAKRQVGRLDTVSLAESLVI